MKEMKQRHKLINKANARGDNGYAKNIEKKKNKKGKELERQIQEEIQKFQEIQAKLDPIIEKMYD